MLTPPVVLEGRDNYGSQKMSNPFSLDNADALKQIKGQGNYDSGQSHRVVFQVCTTAFVWFIFLKALPGIFFLIKWK